MRHVDLITESRLRDIARDNFIDPDDSSMSEDLYALGLPHEPGIWEYYATDSFSLPESDYYKIGEIEESEEFEEMIAFLLGAFFDELYCDDLDDTLLMYDVKQSAAKHQIKMAIRVAHTLYRIDKLEIEDQLK